MGQEKKTNYRAFLFTLLGVCFSFFLSSHSANAQISNPNPGGCTVGTTRPCTGPDPCKTYSQGCSTVGWGFCSPIGIQADGTACRDDGNLCTTDLCSNGTCAHTTKVCYDGKECTTDFCNAANGACTYANKAARTACSNDSKACTDDFCDGLGTCIHPNDNTNTCSDGNACTQTDSCSNGACIGSNPKTCAASDQCHQAGTCDTATGICSEFPKYDGTTCNDGNACTASDQCQSGACSGATRNCDDVNACTTDSCNTSTGCVHATTACNDNNACTTDSCDTASGCIFRPVNCDDGNFCTTDSCNAASGCANTNNNSTQACYTGPLGTAGVGECKEGTKTCSGGTLGACIGSIIPALEICDGKDNDCDGFVDDGVKNACGTCGAVPAEVCDGIDNDCDGQIDENGNALCSDNNLCNGTETCTAGSCIAGASLNCSDNNACTDDSCNPTTGCSSVNDDTNICSDDNACTQTDTCSAGTCNGSNLKTCSASDACHVSTCELNSGNCVEAEASQGTRCDDGIACTNNDGCYDGVCEPGTPDNSRCDDNNICTDDTCSIADRGCKHTPKADNTVLAGFRCNGGIPIACSAELCDGIDNDCDGTIDDGFNIGQSCTVGVGDCSNQGTFVCNNDGVAVCNAQPKQPSVEICDGKDNNCNRQIDENPIALCSDNNICNGTEACNGVSGCQARAAPAIDDGNLCTTDSCDPATGVKHEPLASIGQACSTTLNECSQNGTNICNAQSGTVTCDVSNPISKNACGICGGPTVFEIGNACTTEVNGCTQQGTLACNANGTGTVCNPTTNITKNECGICDGKTVRGLGESCNIDVVGCSQQGTLVCSLDGNSFTCKPPLQLVSKNACGVCGASDPANIGLTCQSGGESQCQGTGKYVCDASNPSGPAVCNAQSSIGANCNDGNACTSGETCNANGSCGGGTAVADDTQVTLNGVLNFCRGGFPQVCPAGAENDNNACTADTCLPLTGQIIHSPKVGIGESCIVGSSGCANTGVKECNETSGELTCSVEAKPNGFSCSDNNACNGNESCQSGVCQAGISVLCTANDACHDAGICDPSSGLCSNVAKPAPATDKCHIADSGTCDANTGTWSFTAINPDDGNACTQDSCDPATGVKHIAVNINDNVACTADSCDATTGNISHTPNNTQCEDNNSCTSNVCNASSGCQFPAVADGTPVENGKICGGGAPVSCLAGQTKPCENANAFGTCAGVQTCSNGTWGVCNAEQANACGMCGGPSIANLEASCQIDVNGCQQDGKLVCNQKGDATLCQAATDIKQNECGLCGGPAVAGVGTDCKTTVNGCEQDGKMLCKASKDAAICNPTTNISKNACGVCGGNTISNLGNNCSLVNTDACTEQGTYVCDEAGQNTFCKSSGAVSKNICGVCGAANPEKFGQSCFSIGEEQCRGTGSYVCDSNNPSGPAVCNAQSKSGSCDDGNPCTSNETCNASGSCGGGTAVADDTQVTLNGVLNFCRGGFPQVCPDGAGDDNNACTIDTCLASTGTIIHAPVNADDNNACTIDSCNPTNGLIKHEPTDSKIETACSLGEGPCAATGTWHCNSQSGAILCKASYPPNGTSCSDNDLCNGAETCQYGSCTNGQPLAKPEAENCQDPDSAQCNPSTGVWAFNDKPQPIAGSCDEPGTISCTDNQWVYAQKTPPQLGEHEIWDPKTCSVIVLAYCGDGNIDPDEQCEGDASPGEHQGCVNCKIVDFSYCGDNTKQTPNNEGVPEQCDGKDGVGEHQACENCTLRNLTYCGDGKLQANNEEEKIEECDDSDFGNATCESLGHKGGGILICRNNCSIQFTDCSDSKCGDGIVDKGEVCDDGPNNNVANFCNLTCSGPKPAQCGNKVVEKGEGCEIDVTELKPMEECNNCQIQVREAICGDGKIEGKEECDDGNFEAGDGCNSICKKEEVAQPPPSPICGDGKVNPEIGEECDDGNVIGGDGCTSTCKNEEIAKAPPICGNKIIEEGEGCDDGNLVSGDGCSESCSVERGKGIVIPEQKSLIFDLTKTVTIPADPLFNISASATIYPNDYEKQIFVFVGTTKEGISKLAAIAVKNMSQDGKFSPLFCDMPVPIQFLQRVILNGKPDTLVLASRNNYYYLPQFDVTFAAALNAGNPCQLQPLPLDLPLDRLNNLPLEQCSLPKVRNLKTEGSLIVGAVDGRCQGHGEEGKQFIGFDFFDLAAQNISKQFVMVKDPIAHQADILNADIDISREEEPTVTLIAKLQENGVTAVSVTPCTKSEGVYSCQESQTIAAMPSVFVDTKDIQDVQNWVAFKEVPAGTSPASGNEAHLWFTDSSQVMEFRESISVPPPAPEQPTPDRALPPRGNNQGGQNQGDPNVPDGTNDPANDPQQTAAEKKNHDIKDRGGVKKEDGSEARFNPIETAIDGYFEANGWNIILNEANDETLPSYGSPYLKVLRFNMDEAGSQTTTLLENEIYTADSALTGIQNNEEVQYVKPHCLQPILRNNFGGEGLAACYDAVRVSDGEKLGTVLSFFYNYNETPIVKGKQTDFDGQSGHFIAYARDPMKDALEFTVRIRDQKRINLDHWVDAIQPDVEKGTVTIAFTDKGVQEAAGVDDNVGKAAKSIGVSKASGSGDVSSPIEVSVCAKDAGSAEGCATTSVSKAANAGDGVIPVSDTPTATVEGGETAGSGPKYNVAGGGLCGSNLMLNTKESAPSWALWILFIGFYFIVLRRRIS